MKRQMLLEPVEFLMTRKMLLGIKQRAEQASAVPSEPPGETWTAVRERIARPERK